MQIHKIHCHLSYADDHVTIIAFEVRVDEHPEVIAAMIKETIDATRGLLFEATTTMGCSINPDKSESIVEPECLEYIAKYYPELV